ncbi:hypothetical protein BDR07DRAFT_1031019 [Suillus spraguei]|nr:hypothetical protein BDR07DRAFT_1031019 [Suillus spraguei]
MVPTTIAVLIPACSLILASRTLDPDIKRILGTYRRWLNAIDRLQQVRSHILSLVGDGCFTQIHAVCQGNKGIRIFRDESKSTPPGMYTLNHYIVWLFGFPVLCYTAAFQADEYPSHPHQNRHSVDQSGT